MGVEVPLRQPEESAPPRVLGAGGSRGGALHACLPLHSTHVGSARSVCGARALETNHSVSYPQGAHRLVAGARGQIIAAEPRLSKAARALGHSDTVRNPVGVRMSSGRPSSSPLPCPAEPLRGGMSSVWGTPLPQASESRHGVEKKPRCHGVYPSGCQHPQGRPEMAF